MASSWQDKSGFRIIVVEPEPDIQTIYRSFLTGWTAEIVDSGKECLRLIESREPFDLVIVDSHVRDMDATELIRRVLEASPAQRIVATSTDLAQFADRLQGVPNQGCIDLIQKPFSFIQLLSLLPSRVPRASKVGLTDHVLAIYEDEQEEFAEAVEFLKRSIQGNETALFVVGSNYDIDSLKARMQKSGIDVSAQIEAASLVLMRNEDWYIPDRSVDKHRIIRQWDELVDQCRKNGKAGLRAFCMMDCFFDHGFADEVVDYEQTLPARFGMPFLPVCAYRKADIDRLSEKQKQSLLLCHSHVWTRR